MAVGKQKTLFVDHAAIKQPKRVTWKVGANSIQILVTVINHWVRDAGEGTTASLVLTANTGVFLCRLHASEHCQDSYQTMRLHRLESVIRLWTHKGVQGDTLTVTLQRVWGFQTSLILVVTLYEDILIVPFGHTWKVKRRRFSSLAFFAVCDVSLRFKPKVDSKAYSSFYLVYMLLVHSVPRPPWPLFSSQRQYLGKILPIFLFKFVLW